jgi:hypothetical protein
MSPHRLVPVVVATVLTVTLSSWRADASAIEDYATYEPAQHCASGAKPGTEVLAAWVVAKFGGGLGGIWRPCSGSTSEHHEGRAFDWTLDATKRSDRRRAARLRARLFATDGGGNTHALARRMGVMYIIWNDHMWSAWAGFAKDDYLSSSCRRVSRCSPTLRHRDHLHISLTRAGGRGETSWYDGRMPTP